MKSFMRHALLGAAGLVALSLSANAAGTIAVIDTPAFKSDAETVETMQLAQRRDLRGPSAGSVGFRNENPGGVGFKQSKKKAKKKKAK
jgi:hypothetical protein